MLQIDNTVTATTDQLAELAAELSSDRITDAAREQAKLCILDTLRCATAGHTTASAEATADWAGYALAPGRSTVWLRDSRDAPPCLLALAERLCRWVPTLALAPYLSVGGELGQHSVQIIRLDLHRGRELRDRDAWLLGHEPQRLVGSIATRPSRPWATRLANGRGRGGLGRSGHLAWATRTALGGGGRSGHRRGRSSCATASPSAADRAGRRNSASEGHPGRGETPVLVREFA
jgi:hypothetical protein